jgi:CheY-like chemotaxis protein
MLLRFLRFHLGAALVLLAVTATLAQDADKDKDKDKDKKAPPVPEAPAIDEVRPGEEYRMFFKKPKTVPEFWNALKFELDVGKYDLAAGLLHGMLLLKPTDEELVRIHDADGMNAFLRLRLIRQWAQVPPYDEALYQARIDQLAKNLDAADKVPQVRDERDKARREHDNAIRVNLQAAKDVEELIKLATAAVKKHLSDPVRINKYVQHLKAGPEERDYALKQLYASGALVVPYLINELRTAQDEDRVAILDSLTRLGSDVVPPMLAALDTDDPRMLVELIEILVRRRASEAVPHLWFLSASESYPPTVRRKATEALSGFLKAVPSRLPPAKAALVREGERYYQHEVKFADPQAVPLWRWENKTVTLTTVPATKAEEYYAVKYSNQALLLDPAYQPAQLLLLSTALDKTYEQTGLALPLSATAPQVHQLIATSNPELINLVLERALNDRRVPVIIGAIRALGQLADVRATRPTASGASNLVRALNYPDRRVHFAAAEALVNIPGAMPGQQSTRIVEIMRRSLAADPASKGVPRVVVAYFNPDQANRVADAVRGAGYEAVRVATGRELMRRLNESADIDLILMEEKLPDPELPTLMAQLRADRNAGLLPILVAAGRDREEKLQRWVQQYRNVTVIPASFAFNPDDLKALLARRLIDPGAPPLTEAEIKGNAEKAVYYLSRLSLGEPGGFDVKPTADVVANALRSGKLSPPGQLAAVDVLARVPTARAQTELANVALDGRNPVVTRLSATASLIKHIQQYRPALDRNVIANLEALHQQPDTDPNLRASLALVLGALRPDPRTAGERLLQFQPNIPPPQPLPAIPKDQ